MFKLLLYLSALLTAYTCDIDAPEVTTKLGCIRGHYKYSFNGRKFSAFEGIRYAKPPIGQARFKESEPITPWKGTWNATFLVECIQTPIIVNFSRNMVGQEDCLFINVYVPREGLYDTLNLDVLVHIHGGGFMSDSGHSYATPDYIMDRDVIHVTFNYRVGIFGFLSTEDEVIPGNNGLKDQVLALKWIQTHIGSFGGNPNSVTIYGLSAGAMSAQLHITSPMSKGLFHRGFSMSGSLLGTTSAIPKVLAKVRYIAQVVGCPITTNQILIDCLRERPSVQLWKAVSVLYEYKFLPCVPLGPVVEKTSSNSFMDDYPYDSFSRGGILDVPWMASITSDEGYWLARSLVDEFDEINEKWAQLAPHILDFAHTINKTHWKAVSGKIKDLYLGKDQNISLQNFDGFAKMISDRYFINSVVLASRMQARINKSPFYFFRFAYPGDHKTTVAYAEDAQFYFYNKHSNEPTASEIKMKDIILDIITSFAKNGTPSVKGVEWGPTQADELVYLNVVRPDKLEVKQTNKPLSPENFWNSLGLGEGERSKFANRQ